MIVQGFTYLLNISLESYLICVGFILLAYVPDLTLNKGMPFINQADMVTELFYRTHIVGRKNNCGTLFSQREDLLFQHLSIDGIEAAEGFIKDQQFRFMQDSHNELDLLLHTF